MPSERLVAVVVTFNRLSQLKSTLAQILSQGDALTACVVFDNGSTDETARWLANQTDARLVVETSHTNLGGAAGFRKAMIAAGQRFDPDWLVLMDDDARPCSGAFSTFLASDRSGASAWATRVETPKGHVCDMNRPWMNPFGSFKTFTATLLNGRNGFHVDTSDDKVRHVDGASFVGLFVSRKAVAEIGYPNPDLFIYGDDVLYTFALTRSGRILAFDPSLKFEHDCETLLLNEPITPLWKAYFYHRNQVFVYRAIAGQLLFWPILTLRAILWVARASRYGKDAATVRHLLGLALRDGLAKDTSRTRADIETFLIGRQESTDDAGATTTAPSPPSPARE